LVADHFGKGAPERVLARCSKILVCDEEAPLDDTYKEHFEKAYKELGGLGERVLGFAYHNLDTSHYPPGFQFDSEKPNFPCEGLGTVGIRLLAYSMHILSMHCLLLVFAGLYALIDPPRPAVPSSVKACQSAGIRVIMVALLI
jgi:sodium/potassium-transporting ATPase subunit alpha